jgi:hypothetical protein
MQLECVCTNGEDFMRGILTLGLMAAGLAMTSATLATLPAEAQTDRPRARIIVKPKRSYLDAGTVVKPGERKYLDYAIPVYSLYPRYGPYTDESRWPLPGAFELPGY